MMPKRGEIWRIPPVTDAKGNEIQGRRFVIVLSDRLYDGKAVCTCAIRAGGKVPRIRGHTISLQDIPSIDTQGVVLCTVIQYLDLAANNGNFIETAPGYLVDAILKKIARMIRSYGSRILRPS